MPLRRRGDEVGDKRGLERVAAVDPSRSSSPARTASDSVWGYMLCGAVDVSYAEGSEETGSVGDLFFWPPGHSVRVVDDGEFILFSPQIDHAKVMDHMLAQMAGGWWRFGRNRARFGSRKRVEQTVGVDGPPSDRRSLLPSWTQTTAFERS